MFCLAPLRCSSVPAWLSSSLPIWEQRYPLLRNLLPGAQPRIGNGHIRTFFLPNYPGDPPTRAIPIKLVIIDVPFGYWPVRMAPHHRQTANLSHIAIPFNAAAHFGFVGRVAGVETVPVGLLGHDFAFDLALLLEYRNKHRARHVERGVARDLPHLLFWADRAADGFVRGAHDVRDGVDVRRIRREHGRFLRRGAAEPGQQCHKPRRGQDEPVKGWGFHNGFYWLCLGFHALLIYLPSMSSRASRSNTSAASQSIHDSSRASRSGENQFALRTAVPAASAARASSPRPRRKSAIALAADIMAVKFWLWSIGEAESARALSNDSKAPTKSSWR